MITLGILLYIIGCLISSYEDDVYETQRREEKRHKELMRTLSETRNSASPTSRRIKRVRRRFVKDKDGKILGEEIIEEWEE